jgi:type II secretory ATPase GspE/PulE/Tfp pilus assembly ATPase PilB-like protein
VGESGDNDPLEALVETQAEERAPPLLEDDGAPLTLRAAAADDESAPVVQLVARILLRSLTQRAEAIHFEPVEGGFRVRFRIDGVLHDVAHLPESARASATARIKIVANLDIAERRMPQNGRFTLKTKKGDATFMVVTHPTALGREERIVLRRLDDGPARADLAATGHDSHIVEQWKQALGRRGLALICGHAGSGRTTTYYASLAWLASSAMSVVSAEAVVERIVPGATQMPLNASIGLSMGAALSSMLRSDPDAIALSEIAGAEVASMAVRAALEGRRVLAGLHVPRAADAVGRLLDMGLEPPLVAHGLCAVLAQRLVRLSCTSCRAKGCERCHGTGYRGRTPVAELLVIDDEIREAIVRDGRPRAIGALARRRGMRTMREEAMSQVAAGLTSQAEVLAVFGNDD